MNELLATDDSQTEYFSHYDADFTTKNFRLEPPTRFGSRYLPELKNSRVTTPAFWTPLWSEIQTPGKPGDRASGTLNRQGIFPSGPRFSCWRWEG